MDQVLVSRFSIKDINVKLVAR